MKKFSLLILACLLFSCRAPIESVSTSINASSNTSENITSVEETSFTSSEKEESSSFSSTTSFTSSKETSLINTSSNKREDSPTPLNKNNKIVLGSSNNNVSSFVFNNGMPDYFRPIYGYNYAGDYYASGSLKISSDNDAKQGFQTAMFVSNKKLEIRLQIGEMHGKQSSNYDKNKPILVISGFDENGKLLDTIDINASDFGKNKENSTIRQYMYSASNVAYLEVIAEQLPYDSGKSYNFGFEGIDLIAWPYE